ncbi:cytochrome P450 [Trametes maxima]|nr:cytochrome P450 [Trametes maxima]
MRFTRDALNRAHVCEVAFLSWYINVFGQPILVLGSHEAAVDLLEKRSALYLDRLESAVVDFGGFHCAIPTFRYGQFCRRHRRAFHQLFDPILQRVQVARFLQRLLFESPKNLSHNGLLFAATILPVAYDVDVNNSSVELVVLAERGLEVFSRLLLFSKLRYLPRWAPGARFKRNAEDVRQIVRDVRDVSLKRTVEAMFLQRDGTAKTSMATTLMAQISGKDGVVNREEEEVAKNTVATLAATQAFFLTLLSFLEVQKKAQAELDAVVGPHRLPNFDDTGEALRHDDEYRGYYIPKGALRVLPNLRCWWYPSRDPHEFRPERFFKDGKLNLDPAQFVFGRRVCPGCHFAEASFFLTVASVLHAPNVSAPLDENGHPVQHDGKVKSGIIAHPDPFECVIHPRGPCADSEALIRAASSHNTVSSEC